MGIGNKHFRLLSALATQAVSPIKAPPEHDALRGSATRTRSVPCTLFQESQFLPRIILQPHGQHSLICRNEVAVTCAWAPDGRHFLTATIAPRLNVDNGYQIWRYTGEKVLDTKLEKLLEATWQPAPAGAYPDLPQSPRAQASTSGKAPTSAAPPQKQGYVPPHSRRGDGTSSAASFSLSHDASGPGKLGSVRGRALPPGAAPPDTKSASKNSKRRSKKKGGGAVTDATGEGEGGTDGVAPAVVDAAVAGQQMKMTAGAWEDRASTAPIAAADGISQGTDAAKKARSLQKKLKQIQQLKDKRDTNGASTLSPEQIQKLESEQLILLELQQLEPS
ncbi:hypothetical protein ABBQ32_007323 [Trebouxia sp. C0010 RCD-2024]